MSATPISVPLSEIGRFQTLPNLGVLNQTYAYSGSQYQLIFNLDNAYLKNQKVRQAIAPRHRPQRHQNTIFYGYAEVSPSPVSVTLPKFFDPEIQPYTVDVALANKLLDEAGFARQADGTRFKIRLLFNPAHTQRLPEYIPQALKAIGIEAPVESYDFATYVKTVYTDRAFDLTSENLANAFDPTVGVQRVYWSKNFKVGLPFSNAAHYANPEGLTGCSKPPVSSRTRPSGKSCSSPSRRSSPTRLPAINTRRPRRRCWCSTSGCTISPSAPKASNATSPTSISTPDRPARAGSTPPRSRGVTSAAISRSSARPNRWSSSCWR